MTAGRIDILGVPVDRLTAQEAVAFVEERLDGTEPVTIVAVNPEKIIAARSDTALLRFLESATLLIPDGVGVVWAARLLGLGRFERVAGADLMPELCRMAARRGAGVFLYGATEEVSRRAATALEDRFEGLSIAGRHHGYVGEGEMGELVASIRASGAKLLFVALGSPRQERWMAEYLDRLPLAVCQGIGGTLDVLAGEVRRAPERWRRWSLEWLYRLVREPGRVFRQKALPRFAWLVLRQRLRGR